MPIIAETKRLILRVPTLDDADESFAIYGDPLVMKWIDDEAPFQSVEQASHSISRGLNHHKQHGCCHWATVLKETEQMIGHCGFNIFEDTNDLELVAHFNQAFWRLGYATEAGVACLKYARDNFADRDIVGLAMPGNIASVKLMEKLNMAPEGIVTLDGIELKLYRITAS